MNKGSLFNLVIDWIKARKCMTQRVKTTSKIAYIKCYVDKQENKVYKFKKRRLF